jgi:hypothetical protein
MLLVQRSPASSRTALSLSAASYPQLTRHGRLRRIAFRRGWTSASAGGKCLRRARAPSGDPHRRAAGACVGGRDRPGRVPGMESVHPPDQRRAPQGRAARGADRAAGSAGDDVQAHRSGRGDEPRAALARPLARTGIFDGEHSLRIEPRAGGGSRFVQSERFSGVLVGLVKGMLAKTEVGFEQMNAALKARVEQPPPTS